MKQYKTLSGLLSAIRSGRVVVPTGHEIRVSSRGTKIVSQFLVDTDHLEDEISFSGLSPETAAEVYCG